MDQRSAERARDRYLAGVIKVARRREAETERIDSLTHDGRGIAAIGGKKVFVSGALPGEQVRLERRRIRRGHDEAELLEILTPAPQRISPRCDVFGVCGGCTMQHLDPRDQRALKQQSLADALQRIGGVMPRNWLEPLFAPEPDASWQYRRRARLAVRDVASKGRVLVGFRERRKPIVTDMRRCEVLAAPFGELIDPLSELVGDLSIRARVPQIELAVADNAVELVFRVLDPPSGEDRAKLARFATDRQLRISLQAGGPGSVEPLVPETRTEALYYELPQFDVRIEFEPTDFVQVNRQVNCLMVAAAVDLLQVRETDRVLDLYCGIGNFSLPLARRAAHVLGIEFDTAQVVRATRNALRNNLGNTEFRCGDLSEVTGKEPWVRQAWDKVLLDPPRSGAESVVPHMAELGAARVVCVSCHPATLARDAGILTRTQGYRLEAAGIIDMFPHTAHVEAIAVFERS